MAEVSPHVAAFEERFNSMVDSIDAGSVAPAAHSEGLISDRQREECFHEQSSYKKAELLLGHIRRSIIGQDDAKFLSFVTVLRRTGHSAQAQQLVQCYEQRQQASRPPASQQADSDYSASLHSAVIQGISQQKLDQRVPETGSAVANIARSIKSWQQVCLHFDLTAAEEQQILGDHPCDVASQRTSLLRKWREKNFFTDATYRKLMKLFYLAGEHDAVEAIRAELLK